MALFQDIYLRLIHSDSEAGFDIINNASASTINNTNNFIMTESVVESSRQQQLAILVRESFYVSLHNWSG